MIAAMLAGCVVAPVPGEPVYEPPAVAVEPSTSVFVWWPWPHYAVEHHYVVDRDRVVIHDNHYFPTYGRSQRYIRNEQGAHPGWYRHDRG
jgi:hypothetical protein